MAREGGWRTAQVRLHRTLELACGTPRPEMEAQPIEALIDAVATVTQQKTQVWLCPPYLCALTENDICSTWGHAPFVDFARESPVPLFRL